MSSAQGMAIRLRMRLLRQLDVQSASYYETTPLGSAIYPLKEPIDEIAYFGSDLLPALMRIGLTTVLTLFAMLMLSIKLAVTVLPLLPVFVIGRRYFRNRLKTDADAVQGCRLAWSDFLQEHIPAITQLQLLKDVYGSRREPRFACWPRTFARSKSCSAQEAISLCLIRSFSFSRCPGFLDTEDGSFFLEY